MTDFCYWFHYFAFSSWEKWWFRNVTVISHTVDAVHFATDSSIMGSEDLTQKSLKILKKKQPTSQVITAAFASTAILTMDKQGVKCV